MLIRNIYTFMKGKVAPFKKYIFVLLFKMLFFNDKATSAISPLSNGNSNSWTTVIA